jgi:glucose/arabinose dehydrogenase
MRRLALIIGLLGLIAAALMLRQPRVCCAQGIGTPELQPRAYLPIVISGFPVTDRQWDPRLTQRAAYIIPARVLPGQGYWRLVKAVWYAEWEPPFEGQHHIFVDTLDQDGERQTGVTVRITSLDGADVFANLVTEAKPGELYAANFPMFVVAPAYRAVPGDGNPADAVTGMGLGSIELPRWNIHTSYGLTWQWVIAGSATPTPSPSATAVETTGPTDTPATDPTPTITPTPSATPTPSVTPTASATASPTVTATPTQTPAERIWDPRLDQRGAQLIPAQVAPGQGYWRLVKGLWYDENEPPFAGKHHVFVDARSSTDVRLAGAPLRVTSLDGLTVFATLTTEAKPGELYAADFPMFHTAPAYRVLPDDGSPADAVTGLGLGSIVEPNLPVLTSYLFVWQWVLAPMATPTATEPPTATWTPTATATATVTPTTTWTPTATPTPSPSPTATVTPSPTTSAWPSLLLTPYLTGLSAPVHITHAGDGTGRLFVVEQAGRIRLVKNDVVQPAPFLDISARVSCCGERGLLSVAFPPDYAGKGHFYVNYTDLSGNTVVARYRVTADPDVADPASEQVVLPVPQPYSNHNGGQLAFGPQDGYLYIGMGDGGSGGDPQNRAQNPLELLGKLLRIDVETGSPVTYTIPAGNPFAAQPGYRPEIWALGLRNPWRFAFDRTTGDLYIGDVGQNQYEEVDFQPASSGGGENYGWRIMEGFQCYGSSNCTQTGLTLPVTAYDHGLGCSISGGMVYRGQTYAALQGIYLYADYCSGRIWGLRRVAGAWQSQLLLDATFGISTFGEDEAGEIYAAAYWDGTIYRIGGAATR